MKRVRWSEGNRVQLLINGEQFYPRVFEAIAAAEREVNVETFILFDDEVGRQLRDALIAAARRGAAVNLLIDGWGSPDLGPSFVKPLADAGVVVRVYEPVWRVFGARLNIFRRMHRKVVVVDGRLAFVGGINYSIDHLAKFGPKSKQDYAVEVEGPLVEQIREFCRCSTKSAPRERHHWWPRRHQRLPSPSDGDKGSGTLAAFVTRDNDAHRNDIERQYRAAIRVARERIVIATAYFFPGWRMLRDLRRAARRGVKVDLILQGNPDMPWVQTMASLLYRHLARAGVCIHEYTQRPLHGKVAVVDDAWATVGSSNLDPLSLGLNMEANVMLRDRAFARLLREHLESLMTDHCSRVELETPGRLQSAWIMVSSAVVFQFARSFPAWARMLPLRPAEITPLRPDGEGLA